MTQQDKAYEKLSNWLDTYRHLIDDTDIAGIEDVLDNLKFSHEQARENLAFDGTFTPPPSDYQQHNTLNHRQQGIR